MKSATRGVGSEEAALNDVCEYSSHTKSRCRHDRGWPHSAAILSKSAAAIVETRQRLLLLKHLYDTIVHQSRSHRNILIRTARVITRRRRGIHGISAKWRHGTRTSPFRADRVLSLEHVTQAEILVEEKASASPLRRIYEWHLTARSSSSSLVLTWDVSC